MKAAILKELGTIPMCTDYPEPIIENKEQVIVDVKASSIKQLDISKAAGKHYTKYDTIPVVVGMDGVATLENGLRIYSMGITGMMAEKAIVLKRTCVPVPDGLDDSTAAALPNFLVGSDIPLTVKGNIKAGDIVLVNGATGSTGMMAVQMAKYHKAGTIIATGRNPEVLLKLKELGADMTISLNQPEEIIINKIKDIYSRFPFDIVIDYLWGRPTEMLLEALALAPSQKKTKIITVGEMAGSSVTLLSSSLRSRDIEILGSGIGSFSHQVIADYIQTSLPEIFQYAASGKLLVDIEIYPLDQISDAWSSKKSAVIKI